MIALGLLAMAAAGQLLLFTGLLSAATSDTPGAVTGLSSANCPLATLAAGLLATLAPAASFADGGATDASGLLT